MTRSSCLLCVSACLRLLSTPPSSSVNLALLSSIPCALALTTEMSPLPKYETLHLLFTFSGQTPVSRFSLSAPHPRHTRAPPSLHLQSRLSYLPQPAQAGPGASHLQQGRVTGSQQEHREYFSLYDCLANTHHKSRDTLLITSLDWIDCVCCCCVGIQMCTVLDSGLQFGPQIILQNCKIARLNVTGFL